MGEAKARMSFSAKVQAAQPFCVYCGGVHSSSDIDHVPPIGIFTGRQRPREPVVSVCKECHNGTRETDHVVTFMSRINPDPITPQEEADVQKVIQSVGRRNPALFNELGRGVDYETYGVLNASGPILTNHMQRFIARMGLAFHFLQTGQIIPNEGGVFVRWYSNADAVRGRIPSELFKVLGGTQTLFQGKFSVGDQFTYSFGTDETRMAFFFTFRKSFAGLAFTSPAVAEFPAEIENSQQIYRPGFLKA